MKTIQFKVLVWAMALTFLFVFSACNGVIEKDDVNSKDDKEKVEPVSSDPSVTVGAEKVSAVSAVLKGKANLSTSASSDLMVGFQYSLSSGILPSNSTTVEAADADAQFNYSTGITGLKPKTTYYFRSILRQNGQDSYGETMSFTTKELSSMFETNDATEVGPTSAVLNAKLDLADVQCDNIECGFYWGTTESSLDSYLKGGDIAENTYKALCTSLSHKTQYWYKAYLQVDDQEFYGAVKTFTIDVVPVTEVLLDKSSVICHTIDSVFTLTATVKPDDATNKNVSWTSSDDAVATVEKGKVTAKGNGTATITVTSEDQAKTETCTITVAQWVTGITLNHTSKLLEEGATVSLIATISPSNANDKSLTWSSSNTDVATVSSSGVVTGVAGGAATITATANDGTGEKASCTVYVGTTYLSSSMSANCYIVSAAGRYKFKTLKGNSSTSVGSVSKAEVLWESFGTSTAPSKGDIISAVSYANNYIAFTTPSTLKNGNAVIAAKDASGNILWSWHIWVCRGYNPASTAQTYYNSAGTMMDRNLGATSATPGNVGALGLLYQWGRKDPFLGSSSISSNTKAKSTLTWPSAVSSTSSNGKVAYAVAHPTTFIIGVSSPYDWVYSSRDNTLWQTSKTIYDPCPPGWRVPDGGSNGVWSKAVGSSSSFTRTYDSTNKGMNFSGKFGSAGTIWYPAAGYLDGGDGSLGLVGGGYWWSCAPDGSRAYYLYFFLSGIVYPSDYTNRAGGRSVRCLQE